MTIKELKNRITTSFVGYGHFKVTILYRGKEYSCVTTNTMAIDKIGETNITPKEFYTTEKHALRSLWDEVKRKNYLN